MMLQICPVQNPIKFPINTQDGKIIDGDVHSIFFVGSQGGLIDDYTLVEHPQGFWLEGVELLVGDEVVKAQVFLERSDGAKGQLVDRYHGVGFRNFWDFPVWILPDEFSKGMVLFCGTSLLIDGSIVVIGRKTR